MGLLSIAIWLPIAGGLLLLALGGASQRSPVPAAAAAHGAHGHDDHEEAPNAGAVRWLALLIAVLSFLVTIPLMTGFDTSTSSMQWVEKAVWIERFNVHYHLGVDGISMPLILLNSFITVLVVLAGWEVIEEKVERPVERKSEQVPSTNYQALKLGERVTVSTLNADGVVTALGESDAEVQIGTIRVRAKMSDLIRRQTADDRPQKEKPKQQPSSAVNRHYF